MNFTISKRVSTGKFHALLQTHQSRIRSEWTWVASTVWMDVTSNNTRKSFANLKCVFVAYSVCGVDISANGGGWCFTWLEYKYKFERCILFVPFVATSIASIQNVRHTIISFFIFFVAVCWTSFTRVTPKNAHSMRTERCPNPIQN